jgi:hypothetical protein
MYFGPRVKFSEFENPIRARSMFVIRHSSFGVWSLVFVSNFSERRAAAVKNNAIQHHPSLYKRVFSSLRAPSMFLIGLSPGAVRCLRNAAKPIYEGKMVPNP